MSRLQIYLLGKIQLIYNGQLISTIYQPRQQSLLAYLLLHQETNLSRRDIAFRFWPNVPEQQAFTNLRKALYRLRSALPDADSFLYSDTKTVQWRPEAPFSLDVNTFEKTVTEADNAYKAGNPLQAAQLWAEAAEVYRGKLLPHCYDDWLLDHQERLHQEIINALNQLGNWQETQRTYPAAIRTTQQLLHIDPLHEETHRRLMRLYLLNDERAKALRAYHTCVTQLQQELGVDPSPATQEIYNRIVTKTDLTPSSVIDASQHLSQLPLVGRQLEWQRLSDAWKAASCGSRCVMITGEAGIGKTRLAEELLLSAGRQGFATVRSRAYESGRGLAYTPVADWLRSKTFQTACQNLEPVWLTEITRVLPELLTQYPNLPPPQPLNENWQRHRLFEALARAILQADPPLLLLLDDLQWCDKETLEWLSYLLHFDKKARLLLVGTVRTEEIDTSHPLNTLQRDLRRMGLLINIELEALDASTTTALAEQVAKKPLENQIAEKLYQETEGNPLFIVETIRAGAFDSPLADDLANEAALPLRIQTVIDFRLDQLSPSARGLIDVAAVIGREFTFDLLAAASTTSSETVMNALDEAWQRRIIREQHQSRYDFSHGKIRDFACSRLSSIRRCWLHQAVAQAIETLHQPNLDLVSSQLAEHYEQAGQPEKAIGYYWQAAQTGRALGALTETGDLLRRGLALLKTQPDTPTRIHDELNLLTMLASIITSQQGYSAPEANQLYEQALAISKRAKKSLQTGLAQFGILLFYYIRGELAIAEALGWQMVTQAEQAPPLLKIGHGSLGYVYFTWGRLEECRYHVTKSMAQANDQNFPQILNISTANLMHLSIALWYLGYPQQALQKNQEALHLVQTETEPEQRAIAYFGIAFFYGCLGQPDLCERYSRIGLNLCQEYGLHYWHGSLSLWHNFSRSKQNLLSEAEIAAIEQQINGLMDSGTRMNAGLYLNVLAEVYYNYQQYETTLKTVDKALTEMEHLGGHFLAAEMYRLKGLCLLALSDEHQAEAEGCFQQALTIARQQQAKSLELRAATALARLWQQQGRIEQAYSLLAEVYGWFTEGFDTPDLRAAKKLLDQLSPN
ncbi:MAG: AAA family ATPase [Anaerolineae bacterium]|nr:AAA family ATPase [Anaerolineae bacterium]